MKNNPANDNLKKHNTLTDFSEAEKIRAELHKLDIKETNQKEKTQKTQSSAGDMAKGMTASMHVVSGVLVGGLIGYGFDIFANSLPFATVIMLPIGLAAGFRNMIKTLDGK
jgi:ATP synthase protein I